MIDAKAFGVELAGIVKSATDPLRATIAAQEQAIISLTTGMAAMAKQIEALQAPRDGADGKDGASVCIDDVMPALTERVDAFLASIPAPQDGKDGAPGKDGADGKPGEKGADGASICGALIDRDGGLVVTLSNGEVKSLGPVVGKDGRDGIDGQKGLDGADGRDGLGFEDVDFVYDDTGRAIAQFQRGDVVKSIPLPGFVDRGIFREGEKYVRGDATTFGGNLWLAQEPTTEKPGEGKGWRLAVKKGRDGVHGELRAAREMKPIRIGGGNG